MNLSELNTITLQGQIALTPRAELPFKMIPQVLFINLSLPFKKIFFS